MPYNTRHKSLSLPSLGIHIPVTHAARAAAAAAATSKSSKRSSSSPSSSLPSTPGQLSESTSDALDAPPSKKLKRSRDTVEQTPPPSPTPVASVGMLDADVQPKIDLRGTNDDIVEASLLQLQSTANRPHLIKELATVLSQTLTSVQQSANPCAIISSRLTTYMKRSCWSALAPCPLAKELETVHPRRTYFFLTTCPRQPLPDASISQPIRVLVSATPSASLTDDSGSDDVESRRRELSPSPEVDLSTPEFDDMDDGSGMTMTPIGPFKLRHTQVRHGRDQRRDSPPLETDEREFTQTADFLQKRKLSHDDTPATTEATDRLSVHEYGYRDDLLFGDRTVPAMTLLASPAMRPSTTFNMRKEDEADGWLKLFEWDTTAESIEIDELDYLLDAY